MIRTRLRPLSFADSRLAGSPRRRTMGYGVAMAVGRALPLATVLLAVPLLPKGTFGELAVAASLFAIATAAGDLGLDSATTLSLSTAYGKPGEVVLLRTVNTVRCCLAVAIGVGVTIVGQANTFSSGTAVFALLLLPLTLTVTSSNATIRVHSRLGSPRQEASLLLQERLLGAMFLVTALAVGVTPLLAIAAAYLLAGLLLWLRGDVRQRLNLVAPMRVTAAGASPVLRSVAPFAASAICASLYWRADVIIIQHLRNAEDVATYTLGYYPILLLALVPGATAVLVLARSHRADPPVGERSTLGSLALAGLSCAALLAGAAAVVLLADPHSLHRRSLLVLMVASAALPAIWVNPQLAMRLRAGGWAWAVAAVSASALAVNIMGTLLLVHAFGILGAAVASSVTEGFALACCIVLARRRALL